MVAPAFASATTDPAPAEDPGLPTDLDPFSSVQRTADQILERVRRLLVPPGFAPLRVLVVDDHPDAAESLAVVLEMLGCPVRACHDGWAALNAAQEFAPDVCLVDLMMPGMDGLDLAGRLKVWAAGRPLLVVATTALGDEYTKARTAIAGFHEHLVKPVDTPTLIATLTRLGQILARQERHTPPPYRSPGTPLEGDEELGHS